MNIPQALAQIVEGNDLSQDDAAAAFLQIMSGEATPGQIGALPVSYTHLRAHET